VGVCEEIAAKQAATKLQLNFAKKQKQSMSSFHGRKWSSDIGIIHRQAAGDY